MEDSYVNMNKPYVSDAHRFIVEAEGEFNNCTIIDTAVETWLYNNLYLFTRYNKDKIKHLLANNIDIILELASDYIKSSGLELEEEGSNKQ